MNRLTKYEQETIISFNAGERIATLYTCDNAVMRKLDALVTEYPEIYKCIKETDISKTYSMPKQCVNYRKPRRISEDIKKQRVEMMMKINKNK